MLIRHPLNPSWLNCDINVLCLARDETTLIETTLERRRQRDGSSLWAVKRLSLCLTKAGEWVYEPQPSSRDAAFLIICRWEDPIEAMDAWRKQAVASGLAPSVNRKQTRVRGAGKQKQPPTSLMRRRPVKRASK